VEVRPMGRREAREVARLRVRMLEELGEMGGEDPRTLVGATEAFLQRRIGSGRHFTSVAEADGPRRTLPPRSTFRSLHPVSHYHR
jgi:hypothetical protein